MASLSSNEKIIPAGKLVHVVLRTAQLKPMVTFYEQLLGAHAVYETDWICFLTHDDEHHRVAITQVPPGPAAAAGPGPPPPGLDHIAFTFASVRELAAVYTQRKKLYGLTPVWSVNHGPTLSMYYQDPDGNKIEFQVEAFATSQEATNFMKSPDFAANPFGTDFDPEDLLKRLERGESEAEILKRPITGYRGLETVPGFEFLAEAKL
jgi:catechol 2,3-dioxygenase-like lactoylglutathione lyase family enzyme